MLPLADDVDDDATRVLPRPLGLGVAPLDTRFSSEQPEDHSPTSPDASWAPDAEERPEDDHRATVPAGPPVEQAPRDDLPWWLRFGGYLVRPFVKRWRALTEPAPVSMLRLPPPPMVNARATLVSAGEVAEADRGEHILDEVFRVPPAYLLGLEIVVRYARNLHHDGADAVLMGRVHLSLSRVHAQQGGVVVPIGRLRERRCDVTPRRIDRALLELEAEGVLALLPPSASAEVDGAVLLDELRGALARIDLRRPL